MKKFICITILVVFILTLGCMGAGFTDVSKGAWYYNTVVEMTDKGILSGYKDGSFKPNDSITSAEFTAIVCRIKGVEPTGSFSHWAGGYMAAALNNGWYDYDEDPPTGEKFDKPIERQLAVKILMKALADDLTYDYNVESAKIKDFSQLNGRYYDTVLAAYSAGIAGGDNNGNFNPLSPLTRAEACTLIKKAMDKYKVTTVNTESEKHALEPEQPITVRSGGVSENGALCVKGSQLCNEDGEPVVLRGMSSHGLQWFPQFVSNDYIKAVGDRGANVMRFAMYTEQNGYIQDSSVKTTLISGVDNALANDMYAIIDWHILVDGNPLKHVDEAELFFKEMAERYKNSKGVIYEICNEPNGSVIWSYEVKPYAERIISAIRKIDKDAIILVGSPDWSKDLDNVSKDRLSYDNIMYTFHFYAGTHTQQYRDKVAGAINAGIPVFISEWGTSDAGGSGDVYVDETRNWLKFMEEKNLSWCNWSLCDKDETSAALLSGSNAADGLSDSELSASGKIVFNSFK